MCAPDLSPYLSTIAGRIQSHPEVREYLFERYGAVVPSPDEIRITDVHVTPSSNHQVPINITLSVRYPQITSQGGVHTRTWSESTLFDTSCVILERCGDLLEDLYAEDSSEQ